MMSAERSMRQVTERRVAVAISCVLSVSLSGAPPASADENAQYALNGTFIAASDGRWAKVNDRYQDVPSVRSTWTITSTCDGPMDCQGTITSDQGWTIQLRKPNQVWSAEHIVPDWQRCPDGTTSPGRQLFRFWRIDDTGAADLSSTSPLFEGEDKTMGDSGACGVNKWLSVRIPLIIRQIG
jgi:hypothetical protein